MAYKKIIIFSKRYCNEVIVDFSDDYIFWKLEDHLSQFVSHKNELWHRPPVLKYAMMY